MSNMYNEIYQSAFEDEIEKISQEQGVMDELRDPRLYSNLKGMLTGKSKKERVAAHKNLGSFPELASIASAMSAGFKNKKK